MGPLARFRALPPRDRRLFLRALAEVVRVRVELWVFPFGRVRARVARAACLRPGARPDPTRAAWAVSGAARLVPAASCLTQALAAKVLLGRGGVSAALRIGVAREHGRLKAHAWLESGGAVLVGGDHDLAVFTPLPPLDGEVA